MCTRPRARPNTPDAKKKTQNEIEGGIAACPAYAEARGCMAHLPGFLGAPAGFAACPEAHAHWAHLTLHGNAEGGQHVLININSY